MRVLLALVLVILTITVACTPTEPIEQVTQSEISIQMTNTSKQKGITEFTISVSGDSLTISKEGYVRAVMMRPSGGFEMRPILQVYEINEDAHAKLWTIVEALDLDELKKLESSNYSTVLDITTTDGRVVIKVSTETFDSIEPLVKLRDELAKVRDKNKW